MESLAEYTKWMRQELQRKVDEITYDPFDHDDVVYNEGKAEAYEWAIGLLDSIKY